MSLVLFYLIKLLFSGFLPFKGNFVCGQNNSKYRDWAPLNNKREIRLSFSFSLYSESKLIKLTREKCKSLGWFVLANLKLKNASSSGGKHRVCQKNWKWYVRHERPCFTEFPNTGKIVENTMRGEVFLTNFEVFGNAVKHWYIFSIETTTRK